MAPLSFGKDRAQRFGRALELCPFARVREIIPILLLAYREDWRDCTLMDLGAGTGYLSDMFASAFKKVIKLDQSLDMFAQSHINVDLICSDIKDVHSKVGSSFKVDIITSLATLHHIYVNSSANIITTTSEELQLNVIKSWIDLLSPSGKIILIDVCFPDYESTSHNSYALQTREYYERKKDTLFDIKFTFDKNYFEILDHANPNYLLLDHIQEIFDLESPSLPLVNLMNKRIPGFTSLVNKEIPIAFFDNIVSKYSIDGHVAYFPREEKLRLGLHSMGLENVLVTCIPTPWEFRSEPEAIWFIHELFGLGKEAVLHPSDMIRHPDYTKVKRHITEYLGMSEINDKFYINWQLVFAYGEKAYISS